MRFLDWSEVVDQSGYTPTLFDELVIEVGGQLYALASLRVIVPGGEEGPGVVAYVAGEPLASLDSNPTPTPDRDPASQP